MTIARDQSLQSLAKELEEKARASNSCPKCGALLVGWFLALFNCVTKSRSRTKAYCLACQQHYEKWDYKEWQLLENLQDAPSHSYLEEKAIKDAELAKDRKIATEKQAKAWIVAPPVDPAKPRFLQFFDFVCPFCSHSEKVGLWYPTKTCAGCNTVILIVRQ